MRSAVTDRQLARYVRGINTNASDIRNAFVVPARGRGTHEHSVAALEHKCRITSVGPAAASFQCQIGSRPLLTVQFSHSLYSALYLRYPQLLKPIKAAIATRPVKNQKRTYSRFCARSVNS